MTHIKRVLLVTGGCGECIAGILLQLDENNRARPAAYIKRSLTDAEGKYSTREIKSVSLVWCIENLHLYLYQKKLNIRVDHHSLFYIFGPKSQNNAGVVGNYSYNHITLISSTKKFLKTNLILSAELKIYQNQILN